MNSTDGSVLSPTKDRWNGMDEAWGAMLMQSSFLDRTNHTSNLYKSPKTEEYESAPFNSSSSTNYSDLCWNHVSNGASVGRGSLINRQHKDMLHKNDRELNKQLRIAMGIGFSTDALEDSFNSSQDDEEKFADAIEPTDAPTDQINPDPATNDHDKKEEENDDDEDNADVVEDKDDGVMEWEERTKPPEIPPELLIKRKNRNVALTFLEKQKQKQKGKNVETPTNASVVQTTAMPTSRKFKEDWRAEAKAEQEAKDMGGPLNAGSKPLLGNWRELGSENNWSMWDPQPATQVPMSCNLAESKSAQRNEVEAPTDMTQTQTQVSVKLSQHKKKKNKKFVPMLECAEPAAPSERVNIAPADFRFQTNGVLPSTRNSDYSPMLGSGSLHSTFGNLFQQSSGTKRSSKNNGSFNLNKDEFPTL